MQGAKHLNTVLIMEKKTNVPKLRFPEFEGEWVEKKLGEVSNKITDGTHDTPKPIIQGVPFLTAIHIKDGFIDYENCYYLPEEEHKLIYQRCNPEKGDLLIVNIGAGTGTCAMNIVDYEFSLKNVAVVKPNKDIIYSSFLEQIQRNKSKKIFSQLASGGAQPFLSLNEIGKLKITLPTLAEQTKIASFLTAVDDKLTQLKKKKSLLEEYKKGVMQKLFSQELRFKDDNGEDFPEWEEKKIGKVCKIYDGTHQTPDYVEDGIPFYSVEHVTADDFTKTKCISRDVFERENSRVKLEKGDILMTRIGDIGTAKYIDWDVEASFYVSLALLKKTRINNNEFIYHYISSSFFKNELYQRTIHVAFPKKINLGEIGECLIKLPSLPEQTKIANFLSAIDERINHCSKQIERMEEWKKGLLQQMFV